MRALMMALLLGLPLLLLLLVGVSQLGSWRIEQALPPAGQFIEVDGYRLHYSDHGQGQPLILLHGASGNLRDFEASIAPLLAQDFRVLSFDRPGFGYSSRGARWPDPAQLADLFLSAAERLGAAQPIIIGHSWSGAVVMTALVRESARLRGGVSISGVAGHWAGSVDWTYDLGATPVIGPIFARAFVYPVGKLVLDDAVAAVLTPNPVPADYVARIGAELALRPRSFLANVQDMSQLSEFMQSESPKYPQIDQPLLLIHGDQDELVPFWNHGQRVLPVVPQAQVEMLDGVGHVPHHSAPEKVAALIREFANRSAR